MSDFVRCPDCNARVPVKPGGAKARCSKCDHVFTPKTIDEDEDRRPRKKAQARADEDDESTPRKTAKRGRTDEDEEEPREKRPKKKQRKSSGGATVVILLVGVGVLLLLGGAGVGGYFLFFHDRQKGDGLAAASNPLTPGGPVSTGIPNPGVQAQPGLTAENFQKVATQMTDTEVTQILGPPTITKPATQIPVGGPGGSKKVTTQEMVWQKKDDPKTTEVTCKFTEGRLTEGKGTINGTAVSARRVASKITLENYQKIAARDNWTRSQIEEILGSSSKSLGSQPTIGGFRSVETFEYSDGINRILVHWIANGKYGGSEWNTR